MMSSSEFFSILKIPATREENAIHGAYRRLLGGVNPEDDPEGFKRLRKAYEEALVYARTPEEEAVSDVDWLQNQEIGGFLRELADIYDHFSRRIESAQWKKLLGDPVLLSLEDGETAKWGLFSYLAEHFRLPYEIWQLLDAKFHIREDRQEFKEHLPEAFVDYIVRKLTAETACSTFPYEKMEGRPDGDYDGFAREFMQFLNDEFDQSPEGQEEKRKRLEALDRFEIAHPWYDMEWAFYWFECGAGNRAVDLVEKLVRENKKDEHIWLMGARILWDCGEKIFPSGLWAAYLTWEQQTDNGRYHALLGLAKFKMAEEDLEQARQFLEDARKIRDTGEVQEILEQIYPRMIASWLEKGDRMTDEEAESFCRCCIRSREFEKAYAFFEAHPEYIKDTATWHKHWTVLNLYTSRSKEALEEIVRWRACLKEESGSEEKDKEQLWEEAFSYHMEARALQALYSRAAEEASSEELKVFADHILACQDQALALAPENPDFLMQKMLFLRDLKEDRKVVDLCEEILRLDPSSFWACSCLQEAYENLRMAQEVVDTFYRAKRIYAGNAQIYLRALLVFLDYQQYEDALGILRQAEEAEAMNLVLQVKKIQVLRRLVKKEDPASWQEAEDYAASVIEQLEQDQQNPKLLAEAYRERIYLQGTVGELTGEQKEKVLAYAAKALELCEDVALRYYLGRFYVEEYKDYDTAFSHLKVCEEQQMEYEGVDFYLGRCFEHQKEPDRALAYYQRVMEKNPDFRGCLWRIGWIYRNKFKKTQRTEYADKALYYLNLQEEKFGVFTELYRWRSYIYLNLWEYEKALSEAEKGIAREEDSGLWLLKGRALRKLDRPEEAIEAFEKSITAKDRFGSSDKFCYGRIFQCFLAGKKFKEGIAYFQKVLLGQPEEEIRELCLEYMSDYAAMCKDHEQALRWVEEWYGSLDFSEKGTDSWARTADRITSITDLWLVYRPSLDETFYQKCRDVKELARQAMEDESKDRKDRAEVLKSAGAVFYYIEDFETADFCLTKAYRLLGKSKDDDQVLLERLMKCSYWMGDLKKAKAYGEKYLEKLKEDYQDCGDLGLSMEELLTGPGTDSKQRLYNLFCYAYYTGQYEKARDYADHMLSRRMCWWCHESGCTEEWEIRGLLAYLDGRYADAEAHFEKENQTNWLGGACTGHMMLRRLARMKKEG
ncbi:MAG: tetratricopeptide repeat protein [Lachnospiraceae bacterium]|nr:tetratricopeptide repeat protein [Lachnospiraceae bacterium]